MPTSTEPVPVSATPDLPAGPHSRPEPGPTFARPWFVGLLALVVGLLIGLPLDTEATVPASTFSELKSVLSQRDTEVADRKAEIAALESEIDGYRDDVAAAEAAAEEAKDQARSEIDAVRASFDKRLARLDRRATTLDRRESNLEKREVAVGKVEREIESNTIAGDGLYEVGVDMAAGTYKSADNGSSCYYARLSSPDTFDIISNDIGSGPKIASVSEGEYFETSNCSDWVKQ